MKHKKQISRVSIWLVLLATAIAASGLAGCAGPGGPEPIVNADEASSDKPQMPDEAAAPGSVPALVAGNTEFALDLYTLLFDTADNLFLSPYSVDVSLAMAYAGSRGETARQMADALHFSMPQAQLHPAFNALGQSMASSREGEPQASQFRVASALWGQQGVELLESFLDTLVEHYGAGMRLVDFRQAERAEEQINDWAREQTDNRVEELLPQGALDSSTSLVMTSAATLQAAWLKPFARDATRDAPFTLRNGDRITVPTMEQVADLGYARMPGLQAVELPYAGSELAMVILLPDEGSFEAFAHALNADQLDAIIRALAPSRVRLALPRFRCDTHLQLREALADLGMVDAFGDGADFSGIDGTQELFIEQVYHQAVIQVDEAGTEATVGSAVAMSRKAELQADHEIRVERPFLFLIRDMDSGAILFLGHVVNPLP